MDTTTIDGDNFPCQCHLSQYAYTDDKCPECQEREREVELNLANGNANPDEETEYCEEPYDGDSWDADNDWLASAGWGEM
jgi:hypothetical protein